MKIGQEGDLRKFKKIRIPRDRSKWPRCEVCGMEIKGSKWRTAEGKYLCFRCANE